MMMDYNCTICKGSFQSADYSPSICPLCGNSLDEGPVFRFCGI